MTAKGYFITGTDTGVGKTWSTLALIRYFQNRGRIVVGMKPVASGCTPENGRLVNADALQIQAAASVWIDYHLVNPYAYEQPVSPDIAGAGNPARLTAVLDDFNRLAAGADLTVVEGAGGWLTPVNAEQDMADLALVLGLPVILVVALKLGCINHAKLSHRAVLRTGLPFAGWIAVRSDPDFLKSDETLAVLTKALALPPLGILPYCRTPDSDFLAAHLAIADGHG